MSLEKGKIISQGKTKVIYEVAGIPSMVIIQNKNDITKNDDKSLTKTMASKAEYATATTSMVFKLLKEAGIPVAFERQLSKTEFLAPKCEMIALEVIARRYAVGSYLKRFPNLIVPDGQQPYRFHELVFELFFKTSGGKFSNNNGVSLQMPNDVLLDIKKPVDDPFIADPYQFTWRLKHPKIPAWVESSDLGIMIDAKEVLPYIGSLQEIESITRRVFLVLEGAWMQLGLRLIDFKIEFGVNSDGEFLVADVIDNDSWRLRTSDWQELSKQLFRDNHDLEEISEKYALVAKLVEKFSVPKQAVVIWRGSEKDEFPTLPKVPGIDILCINESGHKSPSACLKQLEKVLAEYPQGGVIIAAVGLSNGLGPILAARTSWPVIAVPLTCGESPNDVWSSLSLPSNVPLLTVCKPGNAYLAALNILAQKNPYAYAFRQEVIETLDKQNL